MQVHEKIRFMRQVKGWSQDEMAEKLDMSGSGYGNIERGETDIPLSRLQEVAKIFGIDIVDLFDASERNVFNFNGGECQNLNNWFNNISLEQFKLQHELEKKQLIIEQQAKEIELLRQQNVDLREVVRLLQKE